MQKNQKGGALKHQLELAASDILARPVTLSEETCRSFQEAIFTDVVKGKEPKGIREWMEIVNRWLRMQKSNAAMCELVDSLTDSPLKELADKACLLLQMRDNSDETIDIFSTSNLKALMRQC